ncbi:MAG: hypothetical protein K2X99_00695 [Gemmatimonadaceae bacterium]|nr:hypothetical protein [Gemmatimonadaceae bacterium]
MQIALILFIVVIGLRGFGVITLSVLEPTYLLLAAPSRFSVLIGGLISAALAARVVARLQRDVTPGGAPLGIRRVVGAFILPTFAFAVGAQVAATVPNPSLRVVAMACVALVVVVQAGVTDRLPQ